MNSPQPPAAAPATGAIPNAQLVTYTHVIYALHSLSIVIGLTSAAFVVTAFVAGLPSIVAVIMNYVKRAEAEGTYLASHFRWQIRTFWFALLWFALTSVIGAPLALTIVLFPIVLAGFGAIGLWVIYRVARGWLALRDGRAMYV